MQNFEKKSLQIQQDFEALKASQPERFSERLKLSWSTWMFGREAFAESAKRLHDCGLSWVELKGDRHTPDSGLSLQTVREALDRYELRVSGACGLFSPENDLSSNNVYTVQRVKDYLKRQVEFLHEVGGTYLIVVPSAVGRTEALDPWEFERSADTLREMGDFFAAAGVKAAIEPIRAAEVSLVHSVDDAMRYIKQVNHPAIAHINADTYHMLLEEEHIGQSILRCGDALVNLHIADSNRNAAGTGMIDFCTVVRALYLLNYQNRQAFVTGEPLGPLPNPYVVANAPCNAPVMDAVVRQTVQTIRAIEAELCD